MSRSTEVIVKVNMTSLLFTFGSRLIAERLGAPRLENEVGRRNVLGKDAHKFILNDLQDALPPFEYSLVRQVYANHVLEFDAEGRVQFERLFNNLAVYIMLDY